MTPVRGMEQDNETRVFEQKPAEALRPFVKRFLVVEYLSPHEDSHLPDTGLVAAFPFRGSCRLEDGSTVPHAALTGLHHRIRHHVHSQGNAVVLALFTPIGAAAFFKHPLDELANTTLGFDQLVGDPAALIRLNEELAKASNNSRRVHHLEEFLLSRAHSEQPDPLVTAAVQWIEQAPPAARIRQLVDFIGLSQSALERRFRARVGTSPKNFAALVRLKTIVRLHAGGNDFTAIAHAAGYFDQSHFNHDFKRMTGRAPESYFGRASAS